MQAARAIRQHASTLKGYSSKVRPTARAPGRGALHVAAFMTDRTQLASNAERYVNAWASATTKEAAEQKLKPLLSENVIFKADGVLYQKDLDGVSSVVEACEASHATNEHLKYQPVAIAANEQTKQAYVALVYEFKNKSSGSTSSGFSLKELSFDEDGKLEVSRVCRQLTSEERQARFKDPDAATPADVIGAVLPKMQKKADEAPVGKDAVRGRMEHTIQQWVSCWTSDSDLSLLDTLLAPDVALYDAYGLHNSTSDSPQRPSIQGRDAVKNMVGGVHDKFANKNDLQGWAVDEHALVGFEHWQSHAKAKGSDKAFEMGGIDMLLFSPEGHVTDLVQFTMEGYYGALKKDT
jgi:hypothetical protein